MTDGRTNRHRDATQEKKVTKQIYETDLKIAVYTSNDNVQWGWGKEKTRRKNEKLKKIYSNSFCFLSFYWFFFQRESREKQNSNWNINLRKIRDTARFTRFEGIIKL